MGPTASGKTELAEALADRLGAQLINADAFQVYRGMDIGTGKSSARDRYLLIDVADPNDQFGLGEWARLVQSALERLWAEGRPAVLVGGTGLYIRALMEQFDAISGKPAQELRDAILQDEAKFGIQGLVQRLRE